MFEMVDRPSIMDLPVLMDDSNCMYTAAPRAAARALALLILGTVAGLGSVALFVAWLVVR